MQRQLLLDTETTGFKPSEGHRIIEFAAVEMINNKLTGKSLHLYFNPERNIPFEATKVHGITIQQVQNKPVFSQCVNQILQFINGAELIIHNAKFDVEFLDHHFLACGKNITLDYVSKITDSLQIARNKFPGAKNSLDALCDRFNVDRSHRGYHSALLDCELLAKVYLKLLSNEEGNNSVADYMPRFTGNKCPECGHNMLIKTGKYGEFEGC
ncbi:MAG: polymerase subunit epsilon, partial [Pseudomonadota bacterium]